MKGGLLIFCAFRNLMVGRFAKRPLHSNNLNATKKLERKRVKFSALIT